MNREQKTSKAVLDALPSTMAPLRLTAEEAGHIGRQLHPEGMLIMIDKDPEMRAMGKIVWEQLGRGFMHAAVHSMPFWLYKCFEIKCSTAMTEEQKLDYTWVMIEQEPSPVRQAKNWVFLSSGYTADEVIAIEFEKEALMIKQDLEDPLVMRIDALVDE